MQSVKKRGRPLDVVRMEKYLEEYRTVRRKLRGVMRELGNSRKLFSGKELETIDFNTVDTPIEIFSERVIEKLKEERGML